MAKHDNTQGNIEIAINVFQVIAEFNLLEQELDKIVLAYYCPLNEAPQKAFLLLANLLRGGCIPFEGKKRAVLNIPKIPKCTKKKLSELDACQKIRNNIVHAVYLMDAQNGAIEQNILGKNIKPANIISEAQAFHKHFIAARQGILNVAKMLHLKIKDDSIELGQSRNEP